MILVFVIKMAVCKANIELQWDCFKRNCVQNVVWTLIKWVWFPVPPKFSGATRQ